MDLPHIINGFGFIVIGAFGYIIPPLLLCCVMVSVARSLLSLIREWC